MTEPEVCEELDRTILEFMNSLKELSSLRNKYRDVVKEVGTVAKQGCIHKGFDDLCRGGSSRANG